MPYRIQPALPGTFSALKGSPGPYSAAITYLVGLWFPLVISDYYLLWSWLVLFTPCIFSWWVRQPIRGEAAAEMGAPSSTS